MNSVFVLYLPGKVATYNLEVTGLTAFKRLEGFDSFWNDRISGIHG